MDSRGGALRPAKEKLALSRAKSPTGLPEPAPKTDPRFLVAAEVAKTDGEVTFNGLTRS